jgi:hypothetical protein
MAIYSFAQPAAPSFIQQTTGTTASDTYILALNSASIPPKGLWVINDRDSARDTLQFNVTLDSQGRFRGPAPVLMELTGGNANASDNNNLIATFSDLRTNPLEIRFNGFNPSDDSININVFNSTGVLRADDGVGTIGNFYRSNSSHIDSRLGLSVWDFISTTEQKIIEYYVSFEDFTVTV